MEQPRTQGILTATTGPHSRVTLDVGGCAGVAMQLTGLGTATMLFEGTVDGQTWTALHMVPTDDIATPVSQVTGNGIWQGSCAGLSAVRARALAVTAGDTYTVTLQGCPGAGRY